MHTLVVLLVPLLAVCMPVAQGSAHACSPRQCEGLWLTAVCCAAAAAAVLLVMTCGRSLSRWHGLQSSLCCRVLVGRCLLTESQAGAASSSSSSREEGHTKQRQLWLHAASRSTGSSRPTQRQQQRHGQHARGHG